MAFACFLTVSFYAVSEMRQHLLGLLTNKQMRMSQWIFVPLQPHMTAVGSLPKTHTHAAFLRHRQLGPGRRQSSLMKYSSLEFKGSTVGPVKGRPRDGDVSRSFVALE